MAKNAGSRVFFGLMVILCVFLCIISLISFSTFVAEHNKIKKEVSDFDKRQRVSRQQYCILFAESLGDVDKDGKREIELGADGPCVFAIWGEVTVCFFSVALGTLLVVKALIGLNALSWLSIVETAFVILAVLLDFVVAVVITAGLNETCDSFGTTQATCERAILEFPDNKNQVQYYPNINTSKATAWIGTGILIVIAILQMVLVCAYCKHKAGGGSQGTAPYQHMESEKEEKSDDKPVAV